MPTYEYECCKCGHTFEEFRSISDPPRQRCPECRGKVRRLIGGGIGVVFKGSGFYVNDSRKGRPKPAANTDGGNAAGRDTKAAGAKPAEKKAKPDGSAAA